MNLKRSARMIAVAVAAALTLTACGGAPATDPGSAETITVTTNTGEVSIPKHPQRVVALDSTSFETLHAMGVTPVAVPKQLLPSTLAAWANDAGIADAGTHREPKLEDVNAADPDLIIGGKRFAEAADKLNAIAPTIDLAPNVEQAEYVAQLKKQTTTLGEIFGKPDVARQLNEQLDAAVKDAAAQTTGQTVFLANHNGGKIDNAAGRISTLLQPLTMTDVFASRANGGSESIHTDSGLSPETIAQANPDWVIVMDRDAATTAKGKPGNPAQATIQAQEAWKNTTFVTKNQILYLAPDFYITEGIQAYTDFYTRLAAALKDAP